MKNCIKCNVDKELTDFPKKGNRCKKCINLENSIGRQKRKLNGSTKQADSNKAYHELNKEAIKERKRLWYIDNLTNIKTKNKIWRTTNSDKLQQYQIQYNAKQYKENPIYKVKTRIRKAIRHSLKTSGFTKQTKTAVILGCSFDEFKLHLESKFEPWMNWGNHGLYNGELNHGWDIDHITPISSAITEQDVVRLNHYTNLQPLCSRVNRFIKRNKIES